MPEGGNGLEKGPLGVWGNASSAAFGDRKSVDGATSSVLIGVPFEQELLIRL
jgi:hypothetical protein